MKGMQQKMNYYLDQEYMVDMEHLIPMISNSSVTANKKCVIFDFWKQHRQIDFNVHLPNQRKLYKDQQKFLGVERPNCLYYSMSQIDL